MDLARVDSLVESGFGGFLSFGGIAEDHVNVPDKQGVYLILLPAGFRVNFLPVGSGGFFKGRNPNVPVPKLWQHWIDGTPIVYIGKAGGAGKSSTLRSRLNQFLAFGVGKPAGHWGGRYIWQLEDSRGLVVCWKTTRNEPAEEKSALIAEFKAQFGRRPFANLRD